MSKYRNKPFFVDGIRFASQREGNRYLELKLLLRAGKIAGLAMQPSFKFKLGEEYLKHDSGRPITYRADFYYIENGREVVEDVKGVRTDVYKIKRALMRLFHGIEVLET